MCRLSMKDFAFSYCILFCPVWLGGLLLTEEEMEGSGSGGRCGGGVRSVGKGNCGYDALHERRHYFQ